MTPEKIKLKKGEEIIHMGDRLKLQTPVVFRALVEKLGSNQAATKGAKVLKGEQKTDQPQGIDKASVLSILQKEIDVLEKHENKILFDGAFEDELSMIDKETLEVEHFGIAAHATISAHILTLKKMYKTIEKL